MMLSLLAFVSCDKTIHEYPGEANIELTVRCSVDLTPPEYFATVECDAENGTSYVVRAQNIEPQGTRFTEPVCLRYIIDLYRETSSSSKFVERKVLFADVNDPNPQAITSFNVEAAKYKVLVWCDYVQDEVRESWYYITDDLTKILYSDIFNVPHPAEIVKCEYGNFKNFFVLSGFLRELPQYIPVAFA
jgi:hypothetical protein